MKVTVEKKYVKPRVMIELSLDEAELVRIGLAMFEETWYDSTGYREEVKTCAELEKKLLEVFNPSK
jgi:hypothetical protein